MKEGLYIGLMSGTSVDAIDAVLVELTETSRRLIGHREHAWPVQLQNQIRSLTQPGVNEIEQLGVADIQVAEQFALAANTLMAAQGVSHRDIVAIGSHGQTIRHRPEQANPFSLQIGDPNLIAERTGITVVADFRRRDIAAGGEGAPLVPMFHAETFSSPEEHRVILNLGGIANITSLPKVSPAGVIGFDTGPANTLLDHWVRLHLGTMHDAQGDWARSGNPHQPLLEHLLSDPFFQKKPPKSTGTEYFNAQWLEMHLSNYPGPGPADIQATLCLLSVETIIDAIRLHVPECQRVIACGGGVNNLTLMDLLANRLATVPLSTTADYGIDPSHIEAMAFAWLAQRTLSGLSGNLPAVTGASRAVPLGAIYPGSVQNEPKKSA